MQFTSNAFVLYFLPAFLVAYALVTGDGRFRLASRLVIIGGTYLFYAMTNVGWLVPFVFATCMDLFFSRLLARVEGERARAWIVAASVVQNLTLLFAFKYSSWLHAEFPGFAPFGVVHRALADESGTVVLPPGISFYLFESMSFVIDCYRRRIVSPKNPFDFLAFISMFPRFIAGPIVRYADMVSSIERFGGMRVADGLFVFAIGFCVKGLLADSCERFVGLGFEDRIGLATSWFSAVAYSFQLYLDFSGYSLMAIGLGLVLGFPFLDNFREPYLANDIADFWRRWHVSLSTWLRDYLYVPLGGNRHGAFRTRVHLLATMVLGGIWHGANATYAIWGAYHGLLLILERSLPARLAFLRSRPFLLFQVLLGWVVFRARDVSTAWKMLSAMVGRGSIFHGELAEFVASRSLYAGLAVIGIVWTFALEPRVRAWRGDRPWHELSIERVPLRVQVAVFAGLLVALLLSSSRATIPFLYFQF